MISVSRLRVTLAYRGCARRMAVARASSACGAMGGGRGGVTTSAASTSAVPKDAQRLGAGPAMYATARSSESCTRTTQCSAWPEFCCVAPAACGSVCMHAADSHVGQWLRAHQHGTTHWHAML